ncbi:hypothetical protein [Halopenitus persicus]|uniref:Uncharacterized protein n=1 Tax=Halopenitus persicus TaxID=1048396 RepID=A0A1H3MR75_9EURY|nr:hypothetical protein [Halopenitus persicus]SDY79141.1 hypothetical protein SAMN05216564_11052 [Halopenitus persicus]
MRSTEGQLRSTRSRILAGLVACWLVVALASGGAVAGVAADVGYQDADAACSSDAATSEFSMLLLLQNGDVVGPGETVELYPGTEARVVFCGGSGEEPAGDAWTLADAEELSIEGSGEYHYTVRTGDVAFEGDIATFEEQREGVEGPTLTIVTPQRTTLSYLDDPVTLRFVTGSDNGGPIAEELAAYNRSLTDAARIRTTLSEAANSSSPTGADGNVTAASKTRRDLNAAGENLSGALFVAAQNGTAGAAQGFVRHEAHHERTLAALDASVERYLAAAQAEARTARLTAIGALLGSFLLFGAVGGGIGQWIAKRDLESIRRERRRRSSVEYGWSDLKKAFAIAALGVIAGTVLSVLLGSTLLEVLL